MNILWIEDFGAGLDSGKNTLNSLFGDLLSFDDWDNDELDVLDDPKELQLFCIQQKSHHTVYLCRNYFDYAAFKKDNNLLSKIDMVMIDVRLDNGDHVDLDMDIPEPYANKRKFHENGGFYIFNDLVHLGLTAEKMCFMTAEIGSVSEFETKCTDIYMPKVTSFEKGDAGFKKLREWLQFHQTDYMRLRRGVIEGCEFLKQYTEQDEQNIQFRDFIKNSDYEVATTDIANYLDTLIQLLPLKEERNLERSNIHYRLFLRTLAHAWEDNIDANSYKKKYADNLDKIHDVYTFAWIMKMTCNQVSHANLLEPLDAQFIAFLFLCNMRAMFKLPADVQKYEGFLLNCIDKKPATVIDTVNLNQNIKYAEQDLADLVASLSLEEKNTFSQQLNMLYRDSTGNPDAEAHDFKLFLLQYFWINQKKYIIKLISNSEGFLPRLSRHIYKRSFSGD